MNLMGQTREAAMRDLADEICRLDLPFDREAVLAIVRGHVAIVPGGPRIPIAVKVANPGSGRLQIDSVVAVGASWMTHMQNLGTRDEPNYIVAMPELAAYELLAGYEYENSRIRSNDGSR